MKSIKETFGMSFVPRLAKAVNFMLRGKLNKEPKLLG